jgi:DTW domain-containing protein YfiP
MNEKKKRKICSKCQRSIVTCYCSALNPKRTKHHYIILQHSSEVNHPLGTALMSHRNLENSTLLVGEKFDDNKVFLELMNQRESYLLYPFEAAKDIHEIKNHLSKKPVNFIILDGTWKKARKIFHLSQKLKELPLIKINPESTSKYKIRKQPKESGLSTIEIIYETMNQIEDGDTKDFLAPFNFLIEKQIEMMGQEIFDKNYN